MRVAIISSGFERMPVLKGGSVDTYAYHISKNLSKLNLEVLLYGNKESNIKSSNNLTFVPILFPKTKFIKFNYTFFNLSVLFNLLKEKSDVDIIHTNTSYSTLLLHHFFKNIVFTSHSAYWWRSETTHKRQFESVKKAKAAIAISRFIEEKMKKYKKENVFYVPNGVDTSLFKPVKHEFNKTLLTVCGISRQKGLIYLIKAFKRVSRFHKDFRWVHIGPLPTDGNENYPYYLQIMKLIKKYNLGGKVSFLGRVSLHELIKRYQNSDLFILPSLWEGMPLVVLEAMSCGLPIISTKISGVADLVTESVGILVKPKNYEELSRAIINLLEDKSLAREMGRNARKRIEKNFSWSIIARKLCTIYQKII